MEKCREVTQGYTTSQECDKWPQQVCSLSKQTVKKYSPETEVRVKLRGGYDDYLVVPRYNYLYARFSAKRSHTKFVVLVLAQSPPTRCVAMSKRPLSKNDPRKPALSDPSHTVNSKPRWSQCKSNEF